MCPAVTGVGIRFSSPPSAREVSARSADGGREATRFSLPQSAAPTAPSQRGPNSAALPRCHCEARSAVAIRPPSTNLRQNRNNSPPNFVHLSKIWKFRRKRLRMVFKGAIFDPYIVNIPYTDTLGCLALPPSAAKQMAYLRNLILLRRVLK